MRPLGLAKLKKPPVRNVVTTFCRSAQQTKWAAALKDWPNERAHDLHKEFAIDGPAIMEKYMKYMEEAGHKWPYRYQFKQLGS